MLPSGCFTWICYLFAISKLISAAPRGKGRSPDCPAKQSIEPADPQAEYGYIHTLVGRDGALMLTQGRNPNRAENSAKKLKEAGIIATKIPAADGVCEPEEDVTRGCFFVWNYSKNVSALQDTEETMKAKNGWGYGCASMERVGCTESHHRALEMAMYRKNDWTLIMEDDAVPVDPADFDRSFRAVWPQVPKWARLVRLGFCGFNTDNLATLDTGLQVDQWPAGDNLGNFRIVQNITIAGKDWLRTNTHKYDAGLCMTAYMVHRSALPDMLGMFPCVCLIDCCFTGGLMNKPAGPGGATWGELNMVTLDLAGSVGTNTSLRWNKHQGMIQYGPIVQDNRAEIENRAPAPAPLLETVREDTSLRTAPQQEALESQMALLHSHSSDLAEEIGTLKYFLQNFS